MDVIRPFLMIGCLAFATGFAGYCAVGLAIQPQAEPAWHSEISAPMDLEANPAKRV